MNDEPKKGQRHALNSFARLGLLLFFVGSSSNYVWYLIFGSVPSIIDHDIKEMITRVIEALRSHPVAMIKFPNLEEIIRYVEPSVRIVIGFIDGLSLPT